MSKQTHTEFCYLFKQGIKERQLAHGAVVLQHAAQHHDAWLCDVCAHQLVHHILAENQAMHNTAVIRRATANHPLHLGSTGFCNDEADDR